MRSSVFLAMALVLGTGAATIAVTDAGNAREVRAQAEASMTLSGVIDIGRDGQVEAFSLDHSDKVDASLASFVDKAVGQWRFEPVTRAGEAVQARTLVRMRLMADNMQDSGMRVRLVDATFSDTFDGPVADARKDEVTRRKMSPPSYPTAAAETNGQGTVLLLVKVDRNGKVAEAVAEQVNLTVIGTARFMERTRDVLSRSAIAAARRWTFNPPTEGELVDLDHWTVRVPVTFSISDREERYGRWEAYIPGPRHAAPWLETGDVAVAGADLLPDGAVSMVGIKPKGPRLLTPLG